MWAYQDKTKSVRPITNKGKMVKKIKEIALKVWNVINGKDADMDGDVDIDDAMLRAKRKAKNGKKQPVKEK